MMLNVENKMIPISRETPNYIGEIERNSKTFITIHETSIGTDFAPDNRTISYYEDKLLNPPAGIDQRVGFHFMVSDTQIVQFLPLRYRTAHAGSTEGNNSICIERVVNRFVDFPRAISNQAKLTATLMAIYHIPIEQVVPHKYWSGKECPARLLAGLYGGWDGFIEEVRTFFDNHDIFEISEINF